VNNTNRLRNVPIFDLSALTVIENIVGTQNITVSGKDPYSYIIVQINGPMYSLDNYRIEEYGGAEAIPKGAVPLKNAYDFTSAQFDNTSEGSRDAEDVARLLMPEFLASDNDVDSLDQRPEDQGARRLISNIGESQINSELRRRFIRPLEKQIARNVGLYDLRLNYNVGSALLKGVSDATGYAGLGREEESVGLDIITKLLSDQLFVRFRTNLDMGSERENDAFRNFQLSEIELTYYIWRNLSLNYANIREESYIRNRAALKYSYEF